MGDSALKAWSAAAQWADSDCGKTQSVSKIPSGASKTGSPAESFSDIFPCYPCFSWLFFQAHSPPMSNWERWDCLGAALFCLKTCVWSQSQQARDVAYIWKQLADKILFPLPWSAVGGWAAQVKRRKADAGEKKRGTENKWPIHT